MSCHSIGALPCLVDQLRLSTSPPTKEETAAAPTWWLRGRRYYQAAAVRNLFLDTPLYPPHPSLVGKQVLAIRPHADEACSVAAELLEQEKNIYNLHRKKNDVNADLAHRAELLVDDFLERHYRFQRDCIPWDYLDTPPADLQPVRGNLNTLLHVTAEVFLPSSLVSRELLRPFVAHCWDEVLMPLRQCMVDQREALRRLKQKMLTAHGGEGGLAGGGDGRSGFGVGDGSAHPIPRLDKLLTELEKDLWYLQQIEVLEEFYVPRDHNTSSNGIDDVCGGHQVHNRAGASAKKDAMSDFVTMSGIVIGRLHRLENEHRTVLDHWDPTTMHRNA